MGSSLSSTQIPVRGRSVAAAAGRGCLGEVGPRRGAAGAMRWDHGGGAADGELVRAKGSRPPAKGFRLPVLRHGRLPPRLARRRRSAMASSSRAAMATSCRGSRAAGSRPPPPQSRHGLLLARSHGLLLARPQRDLHLHFPSLLEKRKFWVRTLSLCMTQTDWICVLIVGDSLRCKVQPVSFLSYPRCFANIEDIDG